MEYWLGWFHEGNEQLKAVAQAAEKMGYTGIAIPDHVALEKNYASVHPSGQRQIEYYTRFPDPLISAATVCAVTERLRVMTYVYILPMREPFSVAKQVSTLAMQTEYRFDFGVGAGWNEEEITLLGHDFHTRGARMDEMLSIMRSFWETGEACFDGAHYRFAPTGQHPMPEQRIPVWVGGKSKAALCRAARQDGWMGMKYPMSEIRELLTRLDAERQRHLDGGGRDHGNFRRFVIPETGPGTEVYSQLADWGVDGTVAMPWGVDDPNFAELDSKLETMQRFADTHIR